ncbi:MAG: hypothetical protein ATN34_00040 [Epulopiscium sp. Nele67-Bin002]|nr:MAG: hypothetical protein BEN18_01120 [Epulopiscium sp. Nuni2H_MBin001]OON91544.1 MAG: hypothetical protein ATN34_00040 [Epulopiscium sp. Nele67-Bin002]
MSKCDCNKPHKPFFNKEDFYGNRPYQNAGICDICHEDTELSPIEEAAFCPPIGEPRLLTLMAPVVFDESGLNLCRVVEFDELLDACKGPTSRTTDLMFDGLTANDLINASHLQLQVVDIDFNFVCPKSGRYSEIRPAKYNPNLSRITLKDIDVTLAVKVINADCKVCKEGMLTLRYLPSEHCPGHDETTNPGSVTFDLYTPYGLTFAAENPAGCNKLVPTINYIGYVAGDICQGHCECAEPGPNHQFKVFEPNNSLAQGVSAQALAKVIGADDEYMAVGLTLYFKVVYFVQYKFDHKGLCVPPKFTALDASDASDCLAFVEGDLLEQSILPLNVCVPPKSFGPPPPKPCKPC